MDGGTFPQENSCLKFLQLKFRLAMWITTSLKMWHHSKGGVIRICRMREISGRQLGFLVAHFTNTQCHVAQVIIIRVVQHTIPFTVESPKTYTPRSDNPLPRTNLVLY